MVAAYRKTLALLEPGERWRLFGLMLLMVVVAFTEVLGISMLLVLLRVLADPGLVETNTALAWLWRTGGFTAPWPFQVFLAVFIFAVVLLGLAVKAAGTYASTRFSQWQGHMISRRLFAAYLNRPYVWFLGRNSADISKSVLSEVEQLVNRILLPGIKLVASALLTAVIVAFLVVVDPVVSLTAAALMGGGYAVIYVRLRRLLAQNGRELLRANTERFRIAAEAAGGFKEVKLMGLEAGYLARFDDPSARRARRAAQANLIGMMPRYAIEGLAFGVLLTLILLLLLRNEGALLPAIPTLGVVAFSVMRLLPALQQIYSSLASIRGATAVLDHIHADYTAARTVPPPAPAAAAPRLDLTRDLALSGIGYAYPGAGRPALSDLTLTIPARRTIGIVGGTGAGKTTLVDIILGLLTPQAGEIRVDGTALTPATLRAWQDTLGYVPQSIYLTDASIAANIAFGVPPEAIDMAAVERAARIAALHDFVAAELPRGYDTVVGERGVRLSGGQRQRIGIARAVYRDPSVLILDEATSALDNITERVVMEAVANLQGEKTVILIAHRLTTVRGCDAILMMERGRVVDIGTYDELVAGNETFRRMAGSA